MAARKRCDDGGVLKRKPGVLSGQRLLADMLPVTKRIPFQFCRTCKRKFPTRFHLYQHLRLEVCTYHAGRPWTAIIYLPESVLIVILSMLPFADLVNALRADGRLLQVHGVQWLWMRRMYWERPCCIWIGHHVRILRALDHHIGGRLQGRLSDRQGRELRKKILKGIRYNRFLRSVIWSSKANRRKCFCLS